MSIHSAHEPTSPSRVLVDNCPRCSEHADHPIESLDNSHLRWLWNKMMNVEFGESGGYASINEARAARHLYMFALFMEKLELNPWTIQAA